MRELRIRAAWVIGSVFMAGVSFAACSGDAPTNTFTPDGGAGGSGGDVSEGGAGGEGGGSDVAPCPETQTLCGGVCVSTDSDEAHCGACDVACADGEQCEEGSCALSCPAGQQVCGNQCVDVLRDRDHCGGCDAACDDGEVCDGAGSCALSCQADLVVCDGVCIDPLTDRAHCGAGADCTATPGTACADGEVCDGTGSCELSCQAGLVDCGGVCTDPLTDRAHCGAGADCAANPGSACDAGEVCNGAGSCELSCQAGLVDCSGVCIDPNVDLLHCGASGTCSGSAEGSACASDEVCSGGSCMQAKLVFTSSVTHGSDFGGHAGADAFCQTLADTAGLPGTYMAWISDDDGSPTARFTQANVPYVLVDGTVVADDWADLTDGTLDNPISLTERGGTPPDSSLGTCQSRHTAWTNTSRSGAAFASNMDCTDWTGASENGAVWGRWDVTDFLWSEYCGGGSCGWQATVMCFQQ